MNELSIVILDSVTLGDDIDFSALEELGKVTVYKRTGAEEVKNRIADADVVIVNKIQLNKSNLFGAQRLKLICVTATGYDNIDIKYCRENSIGVCNVKGYSAESVAQVTVAMALSLVNRIPQYNLYVKNGDYTKSGTQNKVKPVFHEMNTMTWGIVGLGSIGKRTSQIAKELGCRVVVFKREPETGYECVSLDELCRISDIISLHIPLTDETYGMIDRKRISMFKRNAILINVARGAVVDETALCEAVKNGRLGGLGVDVYSTEPMSEDSPYMEILSSDNVIFTPHMAWGAYEARMRCIEEIAKNIDAFAKGFERNRVDS